MGTKVHEPKLNTDGTRVNVRIDIDRHWFTATFLRLPDGTVSPPAMYTGGLSDRPDKGELERRFWEEAHRVGREKAFEILALLGKAPDRPLAFELPGLGAVELTGQTQFEESPRMTEYHVKLNGIRGRVVIREHPNGPKRAASGQGFRQPEEPRIPLEAQEAIAMEIIRRDWGGPD